MVNKAPPHESAAALQLTEMIDGNGGFRKIM